MSKTCISGSPGEVEVKRLGGLDEACKQQGYKKTRSSRPKEAYNVMVALIIDRKFSSAFEIGRDAQKLRICAKTYLD